MQHLGTAYFAAEEYASAATSFERALILRMHPVLTGRSSNHHVARLNARECSLDATLLTTEPKRGHAVRRAARPAAACGSDAWSVSVLVATLRRPKLAGGSVAADDVQGREVDAAH